MLSKTTVNLRIGSAVAHGQYNVALKVLGNKELLLPDLEKLLPQFPKNTEIIVSGAETDGDGSVAVVVPDTLDDRQWGQVKSLIEIFVTSQNKLNGHVFGDTPAYDNKGFIPRSFQAGVTQTSFLQYISGELGKQTNSLRQLALFGHSGTGKTWLASQYYHQNSTIYRYRLWVHADNETILFQELEEIAKNLLPRIHPASLRDDAYFQEVAREVKLFLENNHGWLMVFDNAPNANEIAQWMPKMGGTIIITTNHPDWQHKIFVNGMLPEEAERTLQDYGQLNRSQIKIQANDIALLAKELDYLPLALTHAGVVIAYDVRIKKSVSEYLEKFKVGKRTLLANKRHPATHGHPNVTVTWSMAQEALISQEEQRQRGTIKTLLNFLGWLSRYHVPVKLINALLGSENIVSETLELLRQFSIINYSENNILVDFQHGLFYMLAREELTDVFIKEKFITMTKALQGIATLYHQKQEDYIISEVAYTHFEQVNEKIIELILKRKDFSNYINHYFDFLHNMSIAYENGKQFDKNILLLENLIALCKTYNRTNSTDYATVLFSLADAKRICNQYGDNSVSDKLEEEALNFLRTAYQSETRNNEKHELQAYYIDFRANWAERHADSDSVNAKKIMEEQVLPFHTKNLGEISIEVAKDNAILAALYREDSAKQYALLCKALSIMDELKIDKHREERIAILISLINTMSNRSDFSSFEDGMKVIKETEAIVESIIPDKEAPQWMDLNLKIGVYYFNYEQWNMAEPHLSLVLSFMQRNSSIYYDTHPNLLHVLKLLDEIKKHLDFTEKYTENPKNFLRNSNMKNQPQTVNNQLSVPSITADVINDVIVLPPSASPYEYALLSKAIYSDLLYEKDKSYSHPMPAEQVLLADKGWNLIKFIKLDNDYIGGIWVNDNTSQVVIVHRGSKNVTSWITDIESVVKLKPGVFVTSALELMKDTLILDYRKKGYRLSSTGHSLGGFLAQVCVYWAQRSDFPVTYCPDMNAMVFDSPGAYDFMEVIQSNLIGEKKRIPIENLNIHNFCAIPTIVSTFGTHTGTIWHLPSPAGISFAFINDHRMENILPGFDEQTGQPKDFRRMTDWPQADYSAYASLTGVIDQVASDAIKAPFLFLNRLYKGMRTQFGFNGHRDTWLDQLLTEKSQVNFYLEQTVNDNNRPVLTRLEEDINLALRGHYSTSPTQEMSKKTLDIHHFDSQVRAFLLDIIKAKEWKVGSLNWDNMLQQHYSHDEYYSLFNEFSIKQQGKKMEVIFLKESSNIFDFQRNFQLMLRRCGIPFSLHEFIGRKIAKLHEDVTKLKEQNDAGAGLSLGNHIIGEKETEIKQLKERLSILENLYQAQQVPAAGRTFMQRIAEARVPGSSAYRMLDANDYGPIRQNEMLSYIQNTKPGDTVYMDSSVAQAPNSTAYVVSHNPTTAQSNFVQTTQTISYTSSTIQGAVQNSKAILPPNSNQAQQKSKALANNRSSYSWNLLKCCFPSQKKVQPINSEVSLVEAGVSNGPNSSNNSQIRGEAVLRK